MREGMAHELDGARLALIRVHGSEADARVIIGSGPL